MTPAAKVLDKGMLNAYKALAKKLTETTDIELQADIAEQMSTLLGQRSKLIKRKLTTQNAQFKAAIKALEELTQEAKDAKKDVEKIEKLIKKASKTVDKVTQFVSGLAKVAA